VTATTARVLKAADLTGLQEAEAFRVQREQARQDERAEELAAARAEGVVSGLAMARAEGAAAVERLAAAMEQLAQHARTQHTALVDTTSRAVLANAIDLAEWILRHELSSDTKSLLERLAMAAHALLPNPQSRILVSAADHHLVQPWADKQGIAVEVDSSLAQGDARFDSGSGSVDVTVGAALRVAAQALGVDPAQAPS
jgi:flagellar biosynthesis/type III secretory pathway protein FliH